MARVVSCLVSVLLLALLVTPAAVSVSCSSCTTDQRSSFSVEVRDQSTQQVICDADVLVESGASRHSLGKGCLSIEGNELSGAVAVHVSRAGYVPRTVHLLAWDDGCHVISQKVNVELEPEKM